MSTLAVLLLAVLAGLAAYAYFKNGSLFPGGGIFAGKEIETKAIAASDAPGSLPENLPIEAGSRILQNYEATSKGQNLVQGTVKFTTSQTLSAAVKTYTDFFSKAAWTVVSTKQEQGYETALMRRNDSTVLIVAARDSNLNQNVVEITLTEEGRK